MSEKISPKSPESAPKAESKESREQLDKIGEKLRENAEKESNSGERKKAASEVRKSAEKQAISGKEKGPSGENNNTAGPTHRHVKSQTYKATMRRVESKLPSYQRTFSKVINNPAVDKVSNVAGRTVARPSAILGAGSFAFIALLVVTFYSKSVGFTVSGTEFILFIAIGWVLGLALEALKKLFSNKN